MKRFLALLLALVMITCTFTSCTDSYFRFDDEIMVLCRLKSLGVVRCTFEYEVIRLSDNVVTTTGITSHAFCDETLKPINLKKKFPKYYEILLNCINDTKE